MKATTKKNEKTKMIVSIAVCVLILAASLLMPLAFRFEPAADLIPSATPQIGSMSINRRIELFHYFWEGKPGVMLKELEADGLTQTQRSTVSAVKDRINDECIFDRGSLTITDSGTTYTKVNKGGEEVTLCRSWIQSNGDWRSWLDICFDVDTGYVYYLYLSCENLKNADSYKTVLPTQMDTNDVAFMAAEYSGGEFTQSSWSGNSGDAATAWYIIDDETVSADISCVFYRTSLVDIRIMSN